VTLTLLKLKYIVTTLLFIEYGKSLPISPLLPSFLTTVLSFLELIALDST
jgi:hypothetical protein